MTFFLGTRGNVRLRRGTDVSLGSISSSVGFDDIQLTLNRVGIEGAVDNLFTGDRVDITTTDARGLDFIPASNWTNGNTEDTFSAYVNAVSYTHLTLPTNREV